MTTRTLMTPKTRHDSLGQLAKPLLSFAFLLGGAAAAAAADEKPPFSPSDAQRLLDVSNLAISPEGDWVAYTVRSTNVEKDKRSTDLFMVSWDGTRRVQLTHTEDASEGSPRFSPDGRYLGFIASRGGEDDDSKDPKGKAQIWLLDRAGGEARRLTELPGGVSSFVWSPDGQRLAIVAPDPDPEDAEENECEHENGEEAGAGADSEYTDEKAKAGKKAKTKKPIVVKRFLFKADRKGYLGEQYERLYVFDLDSKKTIPLTPEGAFDSSEPAWSPDSKHLAFTSKRPSEAQPDPDRTSNTDIYVVEAAEGATAMKLTAWTGPDSDPIWSPDGSKIAYVQGPSELYDFYDPSQLAVTSPSGGPPSLPTEELDRAVSNVRWSNDGRHLRFRFDDDRERYVGSVPAEGGKIERHSVDGGTLGHGVITQFEIGKNGTAVLANAPNRPTEIYRLEDGLALSDHNRELRQSIAWADVRGIDTTNKGGTRVGSMLYLPPGYEEGRAYPTIAYIHGGPVSQDGFDFDWMAQAFAGAGYVVVQPNYRGSSGRGSAFSRTLFAKWADGVRDIHAVLDQLVAQGISDPKRLGIGGWSYGGINTNYAIATDTRFAAAVSGSGIANLLTGYGTDQYIQQYEKEIGLPWDEEALPLYLDLSFPFLHADRIETPTLFMCGEKDFNVPLINSEQMYQALRSLDVPTELVIYPGQYHGLTVPSYLSDRAERMIGWYDRFLKSDS